jgi:sterol desaturase/sphingolipid hydroxylase (fatty acid hydroxylase superfamily)
MTVTNFAGGQDLRFFKILPPYVDVKKEPGRSTLPRPTFLDWVSQAYLLKHIWASPNLVWSVIALVVYFLFPYDLSPNSAAASAPLSWAFFLQRFPIWFATTFGYTAYWHVTLYWLNWASRPLIKNRSFKWQKIIHNLSYSLSGVAIWVGFENVFAYLWATNRLPYLSDAEAFSSFSGFFNFALGLVLIPLWRDVHFYFAHRLLHYGPMFTHVHSLHHRNTDIEPFAGLTMHPIEHLYYYACILPSIMVFASPFHFLWNGMHLLLAPGASHSGYEDHFQADNFHYMHHRYFDFNFAGFSAAALDVAFDTFLESFKKEDDGKERADAKATLAGPPTTDALVYLISSTACVGVWAFVASAGIAVSSLVAMLLSVVAGFGPVLVATLMSSLRGARASGDLLRPFHKRPLSEHVLHLGLGFLFCSFPISAACYLCLV